MDKKLVYEGKDYGTMGEEVYPASGYIRDGVHIGDVLMYRSGPTSYHVGVVVEEPRIKNGRNIVSMFGYCGTDIREKNSIELVRKLIPYDLLTDELLFNIYYIRDLVVEEVLLQDTVDEPDEPFFGDDDSEDEIVCSPEDAPKQAPKESPIQYEIVRLMVAIENARLDKDYAGYSRLVGALEILMKVNSR
jgi:hypothetical protein